MIIPNRFRKKFPSFPGFIDSIMIVSGRNLWFIAYWDRDKNTVGLYIPGKCKSFDGRSRFIPGIPKQFNDTNRQYKTWRNNYSFLGSSQPISFLLYQLRATM
jgi:hypothetical protein